MRFFELVYKVVKKIPKGKVMSYGAVAEATGYPRNARQVGWALHVNPCQEEIPCHRVVTVEGRASPAFAFGGTNRQINLLTYEGVEFDENGFVKKEFFFHPDLIFNIPE